MHSKWIVSFICYWLPIMLFAANPSHRDMVVTEQRIASQVGADILKQGGNAIDAAVAVGYALAVVYPCCGNIGGGGFMTIHLANGKNIFINFREKAPLLAKKNMYVNSQGQLETDKLTTGYLAVAVPGTVAGLEKAREQYGTISRKRLMQPAIKLAKEGFLVNAYDAEWFEIFAVDFAAQANIAAIFLKNGKAYKTGERLIQSDLANSLIFIADKGKTAFYRDSIAKKIVAASDENGGLLALNDFREYQTETLTPIYCSYRGYQIISAPPPSSGGITLCEMLRILEHFDLKKFPYRNAESVRIIIEAMRYAFIDRNSKLGDPDFIKNPTQQLLSKKYINTLVDKIRASRKAPPSTAVNYYDEVTDTTHYSIIDKYGNAVALTYTLNGFFGARVIAKDTGFFLNNEMDDFAAKPGAANKFGLVQYDANEIQSGKRPLSSMTPTIVTKEGKVVMVIGSPGGPRIITSILLTLINVIDYHMTIQQAVNAPRFHYQGIPNTVDIEKNSIPESSMKELQALDYHFSSRHPWSAVESIYISPEKQFIYGANDKRREDGAAIGN